MWFLLTAANKTGLEGDLAGVCDATWEQFHFETQWWSGTATAVLCGRRTSPEAGLQSKQNFTLAQKKKNPCTSPSFFPPSLPQPVSLWHADRRRREELHTTLWARRDRNVHRSSSPLHLMLLDADRPGLSEGRALYSVVIFFVSLTTRYQIESKFFLLEKN